MLAILSPSKDMLNSHNQVKTENYTIPQFMDKAERLINNLKKLTPPDIAEKMLVNEKLAMTNYLRYRAWNNAPTPENAAIAAYAYTGEAFRGLQATSFSQDELLHSQKTLRILSGLYGVLRPLDLIQSYRLEMGLPVSFRGITNLYDYWKDTVTTAINKAIEQSPGEKVLINLASVEYSSVIDFTKLNFPVINSSFKEEKSGQLKMVTVYTKRARGLMARFIIQNQLKNSEDIKAFSCDGYYFDNQRSKGNNWQFIR